MLSSASLGPHAYSRASVERSEHEASRKRHRSRGRHGGPADRSPGRCSFVRDGGQRRSRSRPHEDPDQSQRRSATRHAPRQRGRARFRIAVAAVAADERPLPQGEVWTPAESDLGRRQADPHVRGRGRRVLAARTRRRHLLSPRRPANPGAWHRRPGTDRFRRGGPRSPWLRECDDRFAP